MKKSIKKGIGVIASAVLAFSMIPAVGVHAAGAINMDGNSSEWSQVESQSVNGGQQVSGWKVAYDDDNIYLMYTGTANNQWDYAWAGNSNMFTISGNGKSESYLVFCQGGTASSAVVKNQNWGDRNDATVKVVNNANHNTAGPYVVEIKVPKSQFGDSFDVSFAGTKASSSEATDLKKLEAPKESVATYQGISVDGDFSDWNAVAKTDASDVNSAHPDTFVKVATVWDGDYFYIYIKEGPGKSLSEAGTHSNGKFQINSDLNNQPTVLQFKSDGTVEGAEGAIVKHIGAEWEVAIPKSSLPNYRQSLNFGQFTNGNETIKPIIDNVMNLDGSTNEDKPKEALTLDGSFGDWSQVPHAEVGYNTAGSGINAADANAVLMVDGNYLWGHAITTVHSNQKGGEFRSVTFALNTQDMNNPVSDFEWRLVAVDSNGNINWNPQLDNLSPGVYEFYISATSAWGSAANISNADKNNPLLGKVSMAIGEDGKDEMEFYMELDKVAEYRNMNAGDIKTFQNHYNGLGNNWVSAAGTSSGPVMGVVISMAVAGAVIIFKRKRMDGAVGCVKV